MNTPIQLKINLTEELRELLQSKAGKFGVPLTQYVKHVLMNDVDEDYPTFEASDATKKAVKDALKNKDNAIEITDVHEYFKHL